VAVCEVSTGEPGSVLAGVVPPLRRQPALAAELEELLATTNPDVPLEDAAEDLRAYCARRAEPGKLLRYMASTLRGRDWVSESQERAAWRVDVRPGETAAARAVASPVDPPAAPAVVAPLPPTPTERPAKASLEPTGPEPWVRAQCDLRDRLGEPWHRWLAELVCVELEPGRVQVRAANAFKANWVRGHYLEDLRRALAKACGVDELEVEVLAGTRSSAKAAVS
jgi:hypothetical protein